MKLTKKEKELLKEALHDKKIKERITIDNFWSTPEGKEKSIDKVYTTEKLEKKIEAEKTEEKA